MCVCVCIDYIYIVSDICRGARSDHIRLLRPLGTPSSAVVIAVDDGTNWNV